MMTALHLLQRAGARVYADLNINIDMGPLLLMFLVTPVPHLE